METGEETNFYKIFEQTNSSSNQNTEYREKSHNNSIDHQLIVEDALQEKNNFGFKYEEYCDSQVGVGPFTELNKNEILNTNKQIKNAILIEPQKVFGPKKNK